MSSYFAVLNTTPGHLIPVAGVAAVAVVLLGLVYLRRIFCHQKIKARNAEATISNLENGKMDDGDTACTELSTTASTSGSFPSMGSLLSEDTDCSTSYYSEEGQSNAL